MYKARFYHACGNALDAPIGAQAVSVPRQTEATRSALVFTEKEATFTEFYFSATGRVGRKEYFFRWFMSYLASLAVLTIVLNLLQMQQIESGISLFANLVLLMLILVFLVAQVFVGIKRLHDINASGWWSLLWAIPLINLCFCWCCFLKVQQRMVFNSLVLRLGGTGKRLSDGFYLRFSLFWYWRCFLL